MAGMGGSQIIRGKSYQLYSPEWYDAMDADKVKTAGVEGTAQGTGDADRLNTLSPSLLGIMKSASDIFPNDGASSFSSTSGGAGGAGGGGSVAPAGSGPATIAPVDTSAAASATFNRAKDQVGQETSGALRGLRSALAGRGLLGSGAESRGTTSVVTKGQAELGDTTRQNAITEADLTQKNAESNQSAAVTQRGQDIQREQNIMQDNLARSSMIFQQRQSVLNGLMAALSGSVRSY